MINATLLQLQVPARKERTGIMPCVQSPRLLTPDDCQRSLQGHGSLEPIRREGRATVMAMSTFFVPLLPHTCHM